MDTEAAGVLMSGMLDHASKSYDPLMTDRGRGVNLRSRSGVKYDRGLESWISAASSGGGELTHYWRRPGIVAVHCQVSSWLIPARTEPCAMGTR